MSKRPFMKLWVAEFLASDSVALMDAEEIGCYMLLLMRMWLSDDCSLPNDPELLARLGKVSKCSASVMQVLCTHPDNAERLTNKRLYAEYLDAVGRSETRRKAAKTRWNDGSKPAKPKDNDGSMQVQCKSNASAMQLDTDPDSDPDSENKREGAKAPPPPSKPEKRKLKGMEFVKMSAPEVAKLREQMSEAELRYWVQRLDDYLAQHPKKYRSHYRAILSWRSKRVEEGMIWNGTNYEKAPPRKDVSRNAEIETLTTKVLGAPKDDNRGNQKLPEILGSLVSKI